MLAELQLLIADHPFVTLILGSLAYGLLIVGGIVVLLAPRTVSRRVRTWCSEAWAVLKALHAKDTSDAPVVSREAYRRAQLELASRHPRHVYSERIHDLMHGRDGAA